MANSKFALNGGSVAFVGNYLPRRCGIATFTHDLCEAVAGAADGHEVIALAMNDRLEGYDYSPRVRFELRDSAQSDYLFSVSFRRYQRTLHARIEHSYHRFSFDSYDPGVFSALTVIELVEHYKDPTK